METVNLQCGHCGNLMAVDERSLGQPIRCPNCQQVVPSLAVLEPPAPTGGAAIQAEISCPAPLDTLSPQSGSTAEAPEVLESRLHGDPDAAMAPETFLSAIPARTVDRGMRSGVFIALVLIPLISYAVLATIALIILLLRPQPRDPLEFLPDREGDLKGAKHQKQGAVIYDRILPESDLPSKLKVALGQTIQVGDLEIIPQKIELRRVNFRRPGFAPEEGIDDSLVLYLRFRNNSQDVVFSPSDPFFERCWKGLSSGKKPYSFLDIGNHRLWGGPLPWKPGRPPEERDTIEGQEYKMLQPGEQVTSFVCTDPEDHVGRLLAKYQGALLWRVQVRRGLVQVGDREYPATAVIGVHFQDTDIIRPATSSSVPSRESS